MEGVILCTDMDIPDMATVMDVDTDMVVVTVAGYGQF